MGDLYITLRNKYLPESCINSLKDIHTSHQSGSKKLGTISIQLDILAMVFLFLYITELIVSKY